MYIPSFTYIENYISGFTSSWPCWLCFPFVDRFLRFIHAAVCRIHYLGALLYTFALMHMSHLIYIFYTHGPLTCFILGTIQHSAIIKILEKYILIYLGNAYKCGFWGHMLWLCSNEALICTSEQFSRLIVPI